MKVPSGLSVKFKGRGRRTGQRWSRRGVREWKLEDRKHFLPPKGPTAALTCKPAATSWSLPVHPAGPAEGLLFI